MNYTRVHYTSKTYQAQARKKLLRKLDHLNRKPY